MRILVVTRLLFVGCFASSLASWAGNAISTTDATYAKTPLVLKLYQPPVSKDVMGDLQRASLARKEKNYKAAVEIYQKLAVKNIAQAQAELGEMYARGMGVPGDLKAARQMITKAAAADNPKAEFLTWKYADVWSESEKDDKQAEDMLQRAAQQGYPPAELELAGRFRIKNKSSVTSGKGFELLKRAAIHGSGEAAWAVGYNNELAGNIPEAIRWLEFSLKEPDRDGDQRSESARELAHIYYDAKGVKRDEQKAIWYYSQTQLDAVGQVWKAKTAPGQTVSQAELAKGIKWMVTTEKTRSRDLVKVMDIMNRN